MLNVAVFGSGTGSNFRSILAAIDQGTLTGVTIRLVVSNNAEAGILSTARAHALPALHLSQKQFPDEESFAAAMLSALRERGVNFIALAGYLKRVPSSVVAAYRNRIVNIHPALLPRFGGAGMYGLHVHEAVIAAGEKASGASVHYVDEEYDRGPVILQKTVPVLPGDTPESLAARVLTVEHELYPEALSMIAAREAKENAAHT
jgi:phosphoribosylglycinamide formyltransferase-1